MIELYKNGIKKIDLRPTKTNKMSYQLEHNMTIKTKKNTKRYLNNNEILLNNVLDKDFQKALLPFSLMHSMIFLKKYNIHDNFVTSNTFKSKVLSFSCLMIMLLCFVYLNATEDYSENTDTTNLIVFLFDTIDIVFYPTAILVLFIHKVCNSNDNVKFILKLQKIEKITNFTKNNKMYTIGNWFLGLAVFLYVFAIIIKMIFERDVSACTLVCIYCINVNSLYSARIMNLMKNEINICNCLLKAKFENCPGHFDIQFDELHICYMNILDAFKMFKKTLRAAVRFL